MYHLYVVIEKIGHEIMFMKENFCVYEEVLYVLKQYT